MPNYRLYLLAHGAIAARDDFQVEGDEAASAIAGRLFAACSDTCDGYELWSGPTRIGGANRALADPDAGLERTHEIIVLERQRALLDGGWAIAHSPRLLHEHRQLSDKLGAPSTGWDFSPTGSDAVGTAAFFERLIADAMASMKAPMGNVQVLDPSTGALRIVSSHGFDATFLTYFGAVHDDSPSVCGLALRQARRIHVPDIDCSDAVSPENAAALHAAGVRAVQSTPIIGRGGKPLGVISTHWDRPFLPVAEQWRELDAVVRRVGADLAGADACPVGQ